MRFVKNRLASDNGCELKFKNDIGSRNGDNIYVAPSFFLSCFPAKNIDTIKKAQEIFEEVKISEKDACIEKCRQQYEAENPLPIIEEEENIEEEE